MSDDDGDYEMYASLGDLSVKVKGDDQDWVWNAFEESWSRRLDESEEMKEALREANVHSVQ